MKVRLETARLLLYQVAWLKSQGRQAVMKAAMAKLYMTECLVASNVLRKDRPAAATDNA